MIKALIRLRTQRMLFFVLVLMIVSSACDAGKSCSSSDRMPLLMPDDFEELNLAAWRVEEGRPDAANPLIEPNTPWDAGGVMSHGTVLRDPIDGLWKVWQISTSAKTVADVAKSSDEFLRRLTYLESKDGINWYRPKLSIVGWPGYEKTNILLDIINENGNWTYANVFIDPDNKEWPYEMFMVWNGRTVQKGLTLLGAPGPRRSKRAAYRFRSKDGKKWEIFEGPLDFARKDVLFVYKNPDNSYTAYIRVYIKKNPFAHLPEYDNGSPDYMRVITSFTSPDGNNWSGQKLVMVPDWRDPSDLQYLEINRMPVKGGFVGLITAYHTNIQTMDLQFIASRDGFNWWSPDRRSALPNPPLGDFGGGMIWQLKNPVIEGNLMHVYYSGTEGLHGEIFDTRVKERLEARGETTAGVSTPTLPFYSALCRATWDYDRLWALVPSAGGPFNAAAVTKKQDCAGKKLWANVKVKPKGKFEAELLDSQGRPIPGFSRQDCSAVTGDQRCVQVKWKGGDTAPKEAVKIKFYLTRAFLYGFEWR